MKDSPDPFYFDFGADASARLPDDWDEVLVIHMRQGDVMETAASGVYFGHAQPPCAYYEDVIETGRDGGSFEKVLLVTSETPDDKPLAINPCVGWLREKYGSAAAAVAAPRKDDKKATKHARMRTKLIPGPRFRKTSVLSDLFLLSNAVNLAESHSTFTMGAVLLNRRLRRHFFVAFPATINSVPECVAMTSAGTTATATATASSHGAMTTARRCIPTRTVRMPGVTQVQYVAQGWLNFNFDGLSFDAADGSVGRAAPCYYIYN